MADRKVKARDLKEGDEIRYSVVGKKKRGVVADLKPGELRGEEVIEFRVDLPDGAFNNQRRPPDEEVTVVG
jgi:hypothetical protein